VFCFSVFDALSLTSIFTVYTKNSKKIQRQKHQNRTPPRTKFVRKKNTRNGFMVRNPAEVQELIHMQLVYRAEVGVQNQQNLEEIFFRQTLIIIIVRNVKITKVSKAHIS
jgi:hypothetical protein